MLGRRGGDGLVKILTYKNVNASLAYGFTDLPEDAKVFVSFDWGKTFCKATVAKVNAMQKVREADLNRVIVYEEMPSGAEVMV
jgi:hypothetical protein